MIDKRPPSYVTHELHDLFKQRVYQIGCGYADGNDCRALRNDPVFRLGVDHKLFDSDK